MGTKGKRWRRIPKLSSKPHPQRGLYYSTYTDEENGKQRFEFFAADLKESQREHRAWLLNTYDQPGMLPPAGPADKSAPRSFAVMASAFLEHQKGRTVTPRVLHDNRDQILSIVQWFMDKYKNLCHTQSLSELINETDCEELFRRFAKKYTLSQFAKRRQKFWDMARFARRPPWSAPIGFEARDLEKITPKPSRKKKLPPSVDVVKELLSYLSTQQRCQFWMAIGLGFGQSDLSIAEPQCFGPDNFDMRRAKNGYERFGPMRPLVWRCLQEYLAKKPRKNYTLLFLTTSGLPLVRVVDKTPEEIAIERKLKPDKEPKPYKSIDTVAMWWKRKTKRLKETKWTESFYSLRHVGATALASRPGVTIGMLRDFMGHAGASHIADTYMKAVKPEEKPIIAWINQMLDCETI